MANERQRLWAEACVAHGPVHADALVSEFDKRFPISTTINSDKVKAALGVTDAALAAALRTMWDNDWTYVEGAEQWKPPLGKPRATAEWHKFCGVADCSNIATHRAQGVGAEFSVCSMHVDAVKTTDSCCAESCYFKATSTFMIGDTRLRVCKFHFDDLVCVLGDRLQKLKNFSCCVTGCNGRSELVHDLPNGMQARFCFPHAAALPKEWKP